MQKVNVINQEDIQDVDGTRKSSTDVKELAFLQEDDINDSI